MKQLTRFVITLSFAMLMYSPATATLFSRNITIPDQNGSGSGWHGFQEDQEVEPGMATGQGWDLEGFFLDKTTLTMVGGFNFRNGNNQIESGDIFLDVTGDAVYGDIHGPQSQNGNLDVPNTFGYDYVIRLNFSSFKFNVFEIDSTAVLKTAFYIENQGSSPWRYKNGGTEIARNVAFNLLTGLSDAATGFKGGTHNAVSVSLDFLQSEHHGTNFIAHFTMGCGNDNLMGQGTLPNPEPATIMLMGFGLLSFAGFGRKVQKKM